MSAKGNSSRIGTLLSLYVILGMLFPFDNPLSSVTWAQTPAPNWNGVLRTDGFLPANEGTVLLDSGTNHYSAAVNTDSAGSATESSKAAVSMLQVSPETPMRYSFTSGEVRGLPFVSSTTQPLTD
jgi:hypothetical protein